MRCLRMLLAVSLAVCTITPALAVGKVTVDPNASPPKAPPVEKPDPRLQQKVTYDGGYRRLYQVASDISKTTGVSIGCGSNRHDWQVRDVPMIVCVKDLPLGRLLNALAEAAHLTLRSEVSADGKTRTYRLSRSKGLRDEIASYLGTKRAAEMAQVEWQWDALARLGSLPADKQQAAAEKSPSIGSALPLAKLVAALGPEGKSAVMSGEPLSVDGTASPQGALVREWFRTKSHGIEMARAQAGDTHPMPTADDADQVAAMLQLSDGEGASPLSLFATIQATHKTSENSHTISMITDGFRVPSTDLRKVKGLELPPEPKPAEPGDRDMGENLRALASDADHPLVKAKVEMEQPKGGEERKRAEIISALAKATGWSFVLEDFESHRSSLRPMPGGVFVRGRVIATTSTGSGEKASEKTLTQLDGEKWFVDEKSSLAVGCATEWRTRHANLVSESLVNSLKAKLDGSGVELDDVLPILELTGGQRWEWIYGSKDLEPLSSVHFVGQDSALWKLYARLSPEDRALAKSEGGLPLAKFDPTWLVGFIEQARKSDVGSAGMLSTIGREDTRAQFLRDYLTDPARVGALVMRLVRSERPRTASGPPGEASKATEAKAALYMVEVRATDDQQRALNASCQGEFPVTRATGTPVMPTITSPGLAIDGAIGRGSIPL